MREISAEFVKGATDIADCPGWSLPEFALIGRSNVGKSSLLNLLAGRKQLARVSSKPGATRQLNFFRFGDSWALVDLPGYGYSKTPQSMREEFRAAVSRYLLERANLLGVLVLVDSRLSPQGIDLRFCSWLAENGLPFVLVFTKTDKLKTGAVKRNVEAFLRALREVVEGEPRVFLSSARERSGSDELLGFMREAVAARGG